MAYDFIGIYPCDSPTVLVNGTWWQNTVCRQFPAACDGIQFGYEDGQTYPYRQPFWWAYTCGPPQDGGCQTKTSVPFPSSGSFLIDPSTTGAQWAFIGGRTLLPGCYKVLMNREVYNISPPPYPTFCRPWSQALEFTVPATAGGGNSTAQGLKGATFIVSSKDATTKNSGASRFSMLLTGLVAALLAYYFNN
jgi:hypothetical protein